MTQRDHWIDAGGAACGNPTCRNRYEATTKPNRSRLVVDVTVRSDSAIRSLRAADGTSQAARNDSSSSSNMGYILDPAEPMLIKRSIGARHNVGVLMVVALPVERTGCL